MQSWTTLNVATLDPKVTSPPVKLWEFGRKKSSNKNDNEYKTTAIYNDSDIGNDSDSEKDML